LTLIDFRTTELNISGAIVIDDARLFHSAANTFKIDDNAGGFANLEVTNKVECGQLETTGPNGLLVTNGEINISGGGSDKFKHASTTKNLTYGPENITLFIIDPAENTFDGLMPVLADAAFDFAFIPLTDVPDGCEIDSLEMFCNTQGPGDVCEARLSRRLLTTGGAVLIGAGVSIDGFGGNSSATENSIGEQVDRSLYTYICELKVRATGSNTDSQIFGIKIEIISQNLKEV